MGYTYDGGDFARRETRRDCGGGKDDTVGGLSFGTPTSSVSRTGSGSPTSSRQCSSSFSRGAATSDRQRSQKTEEDRSTLILGSARSSLVDSASARELSLLQTGSNVEDYSPRNRFHVDGLGMGPPRDNGQRLLADHRGKTGHSHPRVRCSGESSGEQLGHGLEPSRSLEDRQYNRPFILAQRGRYKEPIPLQESRKDGTVLRTQQNHHRDQVDFNGRKSDSRFTLETQTTSGLVSRPDDSGSHLCPVRPTTDRSYGNEPEQESSHFLCSGQERRDRSRHRRTSDGLVGIRTGIPVPSSTDSSRLPAEDSVLQSDLQVSHHNSLPDDASMVPSPALNVPGPCLASKEPQDNRPDDGDDGSWREVGRLGVFWEGRGGADLSARARQLINGSWAPGTERTYKGYWNVWLRFCKRKGLDPASNSVNHVVDFLIHEFDDNKKAHSTVKGYRSAVSSTVLPLQDGSLIGKHPLVCRLLKGMGRERPRVRSLFPSWDIRTVLDHIKNSPTTVDSTLAQLSRRANFLFTLSAVKRPSDVARIVIDKEYFQLSDSKIRAQPLGLGKCDKPEVTGVPIVVDSFLIDPAICPVFNIKKYLDRVSCFRDSDKKNGLFLTINKPHRTASVRTLCRWLKTILIEAGAINAQARSVRSVGSSTAAQAGIDLHRILQAGSWKRLSTFQRHYFKPQNLSSVTAGILSRD